MTIQTVICVLAMIFSTCFSMSCSHESSKNQSVMKDHKSDQSGDTHQQDDLSLKSDRSALDEMRKEIPEEVKRSNDELALVLQLMQANELGEMQEPSKIRDRFDRAVRERRTKFDKDIHRSRDDFGSQEKKNRDEYFATLKKSRDDFSNEKHDSESKNRFFSNQDEKRRSFFSDQQEKRNDFESNTQEKRKDFEDYVHERQNSFNEEYRSYSKRYDETRKANTLKKDMQDKERRLKYDAARKSNQDDDLAGGHSSNRKPINQKDLDDLQSFPSGASEPLNQ